MVTSARSPPRYSVWNSSTKALTNALCVTVDVKRWRFATGDGTDAIARVFRPVCITVYESSITYEDLSYLVYTKHISQCSELCRYKHCPMMVCSLTSNSVCRARDLKTVDNDIVSTIDRDRRYAECPNSTSYKCSATRPVEALPSRMNREICIP